MTDKMITVAICTYNRAERLPVLVEALNHQKCPIPWEILIVDNNSIDKTQKILPSLAEKSGAPLRHVKEEQQGIVYARNRAIEEALAGTFLAFLDDDELPGQSWLKTAVDALDGEGAECVGGEIRLQLPIEKCPRWFGEELRGFLGEVKYGAEPFWIKDYSTPVWSGNIAYRTSVFKNGLRFDSRYNRAGAGIGGGEDNIMFNTLLEQGARIRYRPDMIIEHLVEEWKLRLGYFLKLHYAAGKRKGLWDKTYYDGAFFGVPFFFIAHAANYFGKSAVMAVRQQKGWVRQAMNMTHAVGMIVGKFKQWRSDGTKRG